MSFKLSPELLAATYASLRLCAPFSRWKLPLTADMDFRVTRHADRFGHYTRYMRTDHHIIAASQKHCTTYGAMVETMAHEMIHLAQAIHKTEPRKPGHNADFRKRAARVCSLLGFEIATFV